VSDFHDLIRLLEAHPEWRAELRRLVLSEELLRLPERVNERADRLEAALAALAEAQVRTEEQLRQLAEAQARTEAHLGTLAARVDALAEAQARTQAQLESLTARVGDLTARLDTLTARVDDLTVRLEVLTARVGDFTARLEALTARIDDLATQIGTLTARVNDLTVRFDTLTARVDTVAEAQARTEAELRRLAEIVAELAQGQSRLEGDLSRLRGSDLERRYRENIRRFFAPVVRHPRPASDDGIYRLLDDALARGALTDEEITEIERADLIVFGIDRQTTEPVYLVAELSWTVGPDDVRRALERARLLAQAGVPARPVVGGYQLTGAAVRLAQEHGVTVLEPPPDEA
jgi:chaperonin cofactor prefoldin